MTKRGPGRPKVIELADAPTWDALASALGITRQGLLLVRTRLAKSPDLPKQRTNGGHPIAAWRAFFAAHNVNPRQMDEDSSGKGDENSPTYWKARYAQQQTIKLELANELTKRQQVPMSEVQEKLSACLMAIRTEINQITPDLAQSLEGIDDYHEREEIIEARINKALLALQNAPWLDEQPLELEEKS